MDLALKTSGAQDGGIQHIFGGIGGPQEDDVVLVLAKSVDLGQELVDRVVLLRDRAASGLHPPRVREGIHLVDKNDAAALRAGEHAGLFEKLDNAFGSGAVIDAGKKFAAGHRDHGKTRFGRHGLGDIGFPASGRAHQKDAFDDLPADGLDALAVLEKVHDLAGLAFGRFHTDDVIPFDVHAGGQELGAAASAHTAGGARGFFDGADDAFDGLVQVVAGGDCAPGAHGDDG